MVKVKFSLKQNEIRHNDRKIVTSSQTRIKFHEERTMCNFRDDYIQERTISMQDAKIFSKNKFMVGDCYKKKMNEHLRKSITNNVGDEKTANSFKGLYSHNNFHHQNDFKKEISDSHEISPKIPVLKEGRNKNNQTPMSSIIFREGKWPIKKISNDVEVKSHSPVKNLSSPQSGKVLIKEGMDLRQLNALCPKTNMVCIKEARVPSNVRKNIFSDIKPNVGDFSSTVTPKMLSPVKSVPYFRDIPIDSNSVPTPPKVRIQEYMKQKRKQEAAAMNNEISKYSPMNKSPRGFVERVNQPDYSCKGDSNLNSFKQNTFKKSSYNASQKIPKGEASPTKLSLGQANQKLQFDRPYKGNKDLNSLQQNLYRVSQDTEIESPRESSKVSLAEKSSGMNSKINDHHIQKPLKMPVKSCDLVKLNEKNKIFEKNIGINDQPTFDIKFPKRTGRPKSKSSRFKAKDMVSAHFNLQENPVKAMKLGHAKQPNSYHTTNFVKRNTIVSIGSQSLLTNASLKTKSQYKDDQYENLGNNDSSCTNNLNLQNHQFNQNYLHDDDEFQNMDTEHINDSPYNSPPSSPGSENEVSYNIVEINQSPEEEINEESNAKVVIQRNGVLENFVAKHVKKGEKATAMPFPFHWKYIEYIDKFHVKDSQINILDEKDLHKLIAMNNINKLHTNIKEESKEMKLEPLDGANDKAFQSENAAGSVHYLTDCFGRVVIKKENTTPEEANELATHKVSGKISLLRNFSETTMENSGILMGTSGDKSSSMKNPGKPMDSFDDRSSSMESQGKLMNTSCSKSPRNVSPPLTRLKRKLSTSLTPSKESKRDASKSSPKVSEPQPPENSNLKPLTMIEREILKEKGEIAKRGNGFGSRFCNIKRWKLNQNQLRNDLIHHNQYKPYSCTLCSFTSISEVEFRLHNHSYHINKGSFDDNNLEDDNHGSGTQNEVEKPQETAINDIKQLEERESDSKNYAEFNEKGKYSTYGCFQDLEHSAKCLSERKLPFCYICKKHFPSSKSLGSHIYGKHRIYLPIENKNKEYEPKGKFAVSNTASGLNCPLCPKKCATYLDLRNHCNYHKNAVFNFIVCSMCGYRLQTIIGFLSHIRSHLKMKGSFNRNPLKQRQYDYTCCYCKHKFITSFWFERHMKMHTVNHVNSKAKTNLPSLSEKYKGMKKDKKTFHKGMEYYSRSYKLQNDCKVSSSTGGSTNSITQNAELTLDISEGGEILEHCVRRDENLELSNSFAKVPHTNDNFPKPVGKRPRGRPRSIFRKVDQKSHASSTDESPLNILGHKNSGKIIRTKLNSSPNRSVKTENFTENNGSNHVNFNIKNGTLHSTQNSSPNGSWNAESVLDNEGMVPIIHPKQIIKMELNKEKGDLNMSSILVKINDKIRMANNETLEDNSNSKGKRQILLDRCSISNSIMKMKDNISILKNDENAEFKFNCSVPSSQTSNFIPSPSTSKGNIIARYNDGTTSNELKKTNNSTIVVGNVQLPNPVVVCQNEDSSTSPSKYKISLYKLNDAEDEKILHLSNKVNEENDLGDKLNERIKEGEISEKSKVEKIETVNKELQKCNVSRGEDIVVESSRDDTSKVSNVENVFIEIESDISDLAIDVSSCDDVFPIEESYIGEKNDNFRQVSSASMCEIRNNSLDVKLCKELKIPEIDESSLVKTNIRGNDPIKSGTSKSKRIVAKVIEFNIDSNCDIETALRKIQMADLGNTLEFSKLPFKEDILNDNSENQVRQATNCQEEETNYKKGEKIPNVVSSCISNQPNENTVVNDLDVSINELTRGEVKELKDLQCAEGAASLTGNSSPVLLKTESSVSDEGQAGSDKVIQTESDGGEESKERLRPKEKCNDEAIDDGTIGVKDGEALKAKETSNLRCNFCPFKTEKVSVLNVHLKFHKDKHDVV